jgi:hypothetical protein
MTMTKSDSIAALAAALAKAQAEMAGASKDKTNPHFKSAYADLASVWEACRTALTKNGLAVMQPVSADEAQVTVTTILTHNSGEFLSSDLTMTATQNTPQGIGSCITYARRYALASMVGVAPEDDDGNAASAKTTGHAHPEAAPVPVGFQQWWDGAQDTAAEGSEPLRKLWAGARPEYRQFVAKTLQAKWDALKAKAEKVPQVVSA